MVRHLTLDELRSRADRLGGSPKDRGIVEMIVVRPDHDSRLTPKTIQLTPEDGLVGDHWGAGPDNRNKETQVTIINRRLIDLVAGSRDRWALAGDNLVVDLDLSRVNLAAGQRLAVGSTVLEITEQPHRGCKKFASRFGADALRFVNLDDGPDQRRRGVYATVVQPGTVSVGDLINRL